jgi:hypothetical protein
LNKETLDDIDIQRRKTNEALTKEIKELDIPINTLAKELKEETKMFGKVDYGQEIKAAKKTWIHHDDMELSEQEAKQNGSTFDKIEDLKAKRYEGIQKLQHIRSKLSGSRYQQFIRRQAKAFDPKKPSQPSPKAKITENPFGVHQASKMVLNKEKIDRYIFSGTDNGIVKMTETIPFDLEKFQYHIKLYNKYSYWLIIVIKMKKVNWALYRFQSLLRLAQPISMLDVAICGPEGS